jgi:probable HAF family extracellular repeat protein
MKDLGTLGGHQASASDINHSGQVVGYATGSQKPEGMLPFLLSGGVMKDLGTHPGQAYAINDAGVVVGMTLVRPGVCHGFLYTPSKGMVDLGALGGPKANSEAHDINTAGQIVGNSEIAGGNAHAFLRSADGKMKDLGTLGGRFSKATRVNDAGQVVGTAATVDGAMHAYLYVPGKGMKDLGTLGGRDCLANDINNRGQIVGFSKCEGTVIGSERAFVYRNGKMIDLNALIAPATGWTLLNATAINDAGQIVGFGKTPDGGTRAFLLTPVEEGLGARD